MGFRQWLGTKLLGEDNVKKHSTLGDADREKAIKVRQQETALRQAEKQVEFMERISNIEYKTREPKESVMDTLVREAIPVLLAKMSEKKPINVVPGAPTPAAPAQIPINEDYIDKLIIENPELVKKGKKMPDEAIKIYLKSQLPSISEEQLVSIIEKIRKA